MGRRPGRIGRAAVPPAYNAGHPTRHVDHSTDSCTAGRVRRREPGARRDGTGRFGQRHRDGGWMRSGDAGRRRHGDALCTDAPGRQQRAADRWHRRLQLHGSRGWRLPDRRVEAGLRAGPGGPAALPRRRPPVHACSGEHRDVRLRLPRLGVITGRIVDERGAPHGQRVGARAGDLDGGRLSPDRHRRPKREPTTAASTGCTRSGPTATWCVRRRTALPRSTRRNAAAAGRPGATERPRSATGPAAAAAAGASSRRSRPSCRRASIPFVDTRRSAIAAGAGARATITIGPDEERAGVDLRAEGTRLARVEGIGLRARARSGSGCGASCC